MLIDQLAFLFYSGLSLPEDQKAIGVPKPLYTRREYVIVRVGDTVNRDAEQGGVHQLRDGTVSETWYETEVFLDITIIEPHDLEGGNTYSLMAQAAQRIKQEVRDLNLYHRDFEVIDWWDTSLSAPDLSDGEGETQVIQSTIAFTVVWAELWQKTGA